MFDSLGGLGPGSLVEVVESTHRAESVLIARRMAAVARLLRHRLAAAQRSDEERGYASVDGYDQASAEVAAAMNLSPSAASYVVSYAETLDTRLPKIAALLAQGRTDWRTVRLIITRTELVNDAALIAQLDESLAARIGRWHGWSKQRISNAVDAAVRTIDADAIRERRKAEENNRYIGITALADGLAEVCGTVAATAATAFDKRLTQLATQVCAGDPRTMDQRRADAVAALAQGRTLACTCGLPGCPAKSDIAADPGGARVVINVVVNQDTIESGSPAPGYLDGYGVIDAEQVRQLVATAAQHVAYSTTSPADALRYQPSAALERAVRCRDLTCRFPGCSRPALRCDVDHTIPFNHHDPAAGGQTVFENLKCLCRQHHILKTFGGWCDRQLSDGTVIWTSPTGQIYRTEPAGVDLFPAAGRPACAPPAPNRRSRSKQRATRITQKRKHNREQRPVNEQRRWLAAARKQEIEDRRWRNHMRDMLFLFKGKPSTSPFCTWINDPREPEDLPPDWKPDRSLPEPLPDEPPF